MFKFKQQITEKTGNGGTKDVEIMVPLKYLSSFLRTFEVALINCETYIQLIWAKKSFIVAGTAANKIPEFEVTDAKLYVAVVTLSTQDNIKLVKQLESSCKKELIE